MPVVQKGRGATNYAQRGMGVKLKEGSGTSTDLIDLSVINNGEWTASSGQAYKKVTVNVPSPQLITLYATTNGEWTASSGQAYRAVTVNVPTWDKLITEHNSGSASLRLPADFDDTILDYDDKLVPTLITCVSVVGRLMVDNQPHNIEVCVPYGPAPSKILYESGEGWMLAGIFGGPLLTLQVTGTTGTVSYDGITIILFQLQL